ncbi:hypothetical protein [Actinopolyspora saharensis]|uniref:hypothetical protein n=1 Tax=Actinopolyspora saharensis TaxID=995062 RepID=UPI00158713ED|nr:hypothetical protein [Actinopolyspora saharensis]
MSRHAPRLRAHLPMLIERLTTRLDEHSSPGAGLLTGEAGARLALHTATTDQPPRHAVGCLPAAGRLTRRRSKEGTR